MPKVTCDMSMSVDGFVAGPNQSLANPFGERVGDRLHRWMFEEPEANAAEIQGEPQMKPYLPSLYQPEREIHPPEILKRISRGLDSLTQELEAAGGREGARLESP
jgi:hypothetical protein